MTYYKKITGDRCYLSPCSLSDAEKWAEWINDLEVTVPLGDEAYTPYPVEKMREDIGEAIRHQQHVFSIVDSKTDQPIGRCILFSVDLINRTAMLGIFIGEKGYWGKGYGQEATRLLLDFSFNLLNLNNIMLGVFEYNKRARRCYQKLGFKEIGRRRQAKIIGGERYDVVFMDILAEEFQSEFTARFVNQEE